ncbi:hypothetical protein MHYP_G00195050 [Metynnis hypsauchen]
MSSIHTRTLGSSLELLTDTKFDVGEALVTSEELLVAQRFLRIGAESAGGAEGGRMSPRCQSAAPRRATGRNSSPSDHCTCSSGSMRAARLIPRARNSPVRPDAAFLT